MQQFYQFFHLLMHVMLLGLHIVVLIFEEMQIKTFKCFDCVCLPDVGWELEAVWLLSHTKPRELD